jgi:hypothetical protein
LNAYLRRHGRQRLTKRIVESIEPMAKTVQVRIGDAAARSGAAMSWFVADKPRSESLALEGDSPDTAGRLCRGPSEESVTE